MTDKDKDNVIDIDSVKSKQLSLNIDIPETTQNEPEQTQTPEVLPATSEQTALSVPTESFNVMPNALKTAANASMQLRAVQANLAALLTSDAYVSTIAATNPEVLPSLMDSVTNAVCSADNLLIKMAQVSEKSQSMQRAFEYLTRQKEQLSEAQQSLTQKDEYYDESVQRIKAAIYKNLDAQRDANPRTAQDYVDENDTKPNSDYIEAEYTKDDLDASDSASSEDDYSDIPEE